MKEPPPSRSIKHLQWAAVLLCAAAIAINYLDRSTIAIAYPKIRKEFDISAAQFGALQSAWSLLYAIAQIPVGLLIDGLGPRALAPHPPEGEKARSNPRIKVLLKADKGSPDRLNTAQLPRRIVHVTVV